MPVNNDIDSLLKDGESEILSEEGRRFMADPPGSPKQELQDLLAWVQRSRKNRSDAFATICVVSPDMKDVAIIIDEVFFSFEEELQKRIVAVGS